MDGVTVGLKDREQAQDVARPPEGGEERVGADSPAPGGHRPDAGAQVVDPFVDPANGDHGTPPGAVDYLGELTRATAQCGGVVVEVDQVGQMAQDQADANDGKRSTGRRATSLGEQVQQRAEEDDPQDDVVEELLRSHGHYGDGARHATPGECLVRDDESADAAHGEDAAGGEAGERDAQHEPQAELRAQRVEDEARETGVAEERGHLEEHGQPEEPVVALEHEGEGVGRLCDLGQQEVERHAQDGEHQEGSQCPADAGTSAARSLVSGGTDGVSTSRPCGTSPTCTAGCAVREDGSSQHGIT